MQTDYFSLHMQAQENDPKLHGEDEKANCF